MNTVAIVLSVLAALGGLSGIVALIYVIPTYKKLSGEAKKAGAEASEIVAQGATILLQPLQNRIHMLDNEVLSLRSTVRELEVMLSQERDASRLERQTSQQVIQDLKGQVNARDIRIRILEGRGRNGIGSWPSTQD